MMEKFEYRVKKSPRIKTYLSIRRHTGVIVVIVSINKRKTEKHTGYKWKPECFCNSSKLPLPMPSVPANEYMDIVKDLGRQLNEAQRLVEGCLTIGDAKARLSGELKKMSLFEFMEAEISGMKGIRKSTREVYESRMLNITSMVRDVDLKCFDESYIKNIIQKMEDAGKSPTTIKSYFSLLTMIVKKGVERHLMPENLLVRMKLIKRPKMKRKRQKVLTTTEVGKLWELWRELPRGRKREALRAILLQCYTGLRISDALRLKPDDVERGEIVIKKTKMVMPLVLSEKALALANDAPLPIGLTYYQVRYSMKEVCREHGIDHVPTHSARRFFASQLGEQGASLFHIQLALGHTDTSSTMKYIYPSKDEMAKAIKALGRVSPQANGYERQ